MLKTVEMLLGVIFQARALFILFYFCAFVTFAPMASILGAKTGQMTFSALFNPLMILSCALLAVYIGFRVAAYKNHGIDCKMDAVFFISLSWIFFMLFCLAAFFATVLFLEDFRGLPPREFCSLLLVTAIFAAWRTLKSSEYKLSVFYERKVGANISIDKILIYSVLAFAAIVAVAFLIKRF